MLSMKAKYALKALIFMAQKEQTALPSKQIAEAENIPQKFLDNILQELRQNGVIESKRGIFGGYDGGLARAIGGDQAVQMHDAVAHRCLESDRSPVGGVDLAGEAVTDVVVGGKHIYLDRAHPLAGDIITQYKEVHRKVWGA